MPMDDRALLDLFAGRSERAIAETQQKYGRLCIALAERILGSREDAEECFNDVLLTAWERIPPESPRNLPAYLNVLTRNIALNRLKADNRLKRGSGQIPAVLDELAECVPAAETVEAEYDRRSFLAVMERFLGQLPREARVIFVRRYWYMNSCREIAEAYQISESKVRVSLTRTRRKLKAFLEKEDVL